MVSKMIFCLTIIDPSFDVFDYKKSTRKTHKKTKTKRQKKKKEKEEEEEEDKKIRIEPEHAERTYKIKILF